MGGASLEELIEVRPHSPAPIRDRQGVAVGAIRDLRADGATLRRRPAARRAGVVTSAKVRGRFRATWEQFRW